MLIEFTVGNFASFRDPVTLSLIAARIRSKNKKLDQENVIPVDKDLSLLTSVAVYGPNASGKSNLVAAASFMRRFVRRSFSNTQFDEAIPVEPFRLSTETEARPSFFEMVFLLDGQQYRYGFEVDRQKVVSEWLYAVPKRVEVKLFERQGQEVLPNLSNALAREYRTIKTLLPKINQDEPLRANALFLSVAAQNNGPVSKKILGWFSNLRFMSGLNDEGFRRFTLERFEDPAAQDQIVAMVRNLDVGIQDIEVQRKDRQKALQDAPQELRELLEKMDQVDAFNIYTRHQKFNAQGEVVGFETLDMGAHESQGTQKLFFMAGPIIDTLANGRVLWIDEMEVCLHPNLTQAIVDLFNSRPANPKRAQLIFTTHDTNLLDVKKLRRDQIWFLEKDSTAASRLYSLVEFKVRNDDASLEDDYIRGRYGAVPHLGELTASYVVDEP